MLSHIGPVVIVVVLLIVGGLIRTFVRNASRAVVAVLAEPDDPDIGLQTQWLHDARLRNGGVPSRFVQISGTTAASVRESRVARAPLEPRPPLRLRALDSPLPALAARPPMAPQSPYETTERRSDSWL